jgi:hypothetical protein
MGASTAARAAVAGTSAIPHAATPHAMPDDNPGTQVRICFSSLPRFADTSAEGALWRQPDVKCNTPPVKKPFKPRAIAA